MQRFGMACRRNAEPEPVFSVRRFRDLPSLSWLWRRTAHQVLINPLAVARYRERHSVARSKSGRRDTHGNTPSFRDAPTGPSFFALAAALPTIASGRGSVPRRETRGSPALPSEVDVIGVGVLPVW